MKDACHPVPPSQAEDSWTNHENGARHDSEGGRRSGPSCDWSPSAIRMTLLTLLSGAVGFVASCSVRFVLELIASLGQFAADVDMACDFDVQSLHTHTHTPLTARGRHSEFLRPDMTRLHFLFSPFHYFFFAFFLQTDARMTFFT